jgi:hypothetical protein
LRQNYLIEHSIPEGRGITHGSEAQGEIETFDDAHLIVYEVKGNLFKLQDEL